MQEGDFHRWATCAVAKEAGLCDSSALLVAWANAQTDVCKGFGFHTQVGLNYLWSKAGLYFHFIPGDITMVVKANSNLVQQVVARAQSDYIALGIALHALQDSYAHQGFKGLCHRANNTQSWAQWWPHYGHTAVLKSPDIVNAEWFDGRINQTVSNRARFKLAMGATYQALGGQKVSEFMMHSPAIRVLYGVDEYAERKRRWAAVAGMEDIKWADVQKEYWTTYGDLFKEAARKQAVFVRAQIARWAA